MSSRGRAPGYGSEGAAIAVGGAMLQLSEGGTGLHFSIGGTRIAGGQTPPGAPFVPAVGCVIEPGFARPACESVEPELFHSCERDEIQKAKEWCRACPYREPCLEAALKRDEWGIWGGLTETERRSLKRSRKKAQT